MLSIAYKVNSITESTNTAMTVVMKQLKYRITSEATSIITSTLESFKVTFPRWSPLENPSIHIPACPQVPFFLEQRHVVSVFLLQAATGSSSKPAANHVLE